MYLNSLISGDENAQDEDQIAQAGKRHGMIKRSKKFIRDARGTTTLCAADAKIVKGYMPYDR